MVASKLRCQQAVNKMQAVANAVLQFLSKDLFLIDQFLHASNGSSQVFRPSGRRNRFGQYVGEAGEKVDVVFVKSVVCVTINLKNAEWRPRFGCDKDIHG